MSMASPVTARRSVSERDETADMEARNALDDLAGVLAGIGDDAEAGDEAEEKPAKQERNSRAKPVKADADTEDEEDDAETESKDDPDRKKPILGEDDEDADAEDTEDDEEAESEDGDDDADAKRKAKALEKRAFKLREQKRELERERESLTAELKDLRAKVQELEALPSGATAEGPFAQAKTEADVQKIRDQFEQKREWLEDLLDDHQESYMLKDANGEEQEYTRKQVRDELKWTRKMLGEASKATEAIARAAGAERTAREIYPFVFDPRSRYNGTVVDLVKETPELNRVPNKALLLGRLTVGKLVESGQYLLVPKHKAKAAASREDAKPAQESKSSPSPLSARKATGPSNGQRNRNLMERIGAGDKQAAEEYAMGLLGD